MADKHFESWEVLTSMSKELWFAKPLDKLSDPPKKLAELAKTISTANSSLLKFDFSAVLFDDYMQDYQNIITAFINKQLGSTGVLAAAIPNTGSTNDVLAGKSAWQKDAFLQDEKLNSMRESLTKGAKETLQWLNQLTQSYILYFFSALIRADLRAIIVQRISVFKNTNKIIVWHTLKKWIRTHMTDNSPHILMESLQTMTRPSGMPVAMWTTTFTQPRAVLFKKYKQSLVGILAWFYWAN